MKNNDSQSGFLSQLWQYIRALLGLCQIVISNGSLCLSLSLSLSQDCTPEQNHCFPNNLEDFGLPHPQLGVSDWLGGGWLMATKGPRKTGPPRDWFLRFTSPCD